MNETSQIRESLHKPYWYDKNSYKHSRNFGKILYFLKLYLILSVGFGFLYSLNVTIGGLIALLVGFITFRLYNSSHYRYYRLIKRTTQKEGYNKQESYIVQTCISSKKIEEFSKYKKVKWKFVEKYSQLEDAEFSLDQLTIKKKVTEVVISAVKKSLRNHNNNFGHRFLETHNINRLQIRPFITILWLLGFILLSLIYLSVFLSFFHKSPILFFQIGFPIIISVIAIYLFYTLNHRYHRLVKRTVIQGRYKDTSIYIQSFISRKKIKEIGEEKNRRWLDFYIKDRSGFDYVENAEYRFNEATTSPKVTDEIL